MKISIITLFPEYLETFKEYSIIKNAIKDNKLDIEFISPRDYSESFYVDDKLYGGGKGMLITINSVVNTLEKIKQKNSKIYLLSPSGETYNQKTAKALAGEKNAHFIFICGHYEGIDSRIKNYIDGSFSIGDYVLTGGELPALIIAESIIRLIPGVIQEESHKNETFENNLIECDQFTKPENFEGNIVPKVIQSGNHGKINKWREQSSIDNTIEYLLKAKEK